MPEASAGRVELQRPGLFALVGYRPRTEEVCRFHNSNARVRIVSAPARTAKSFSASYEALFHCFPTYERDATNTPRPVRSSGDDADGRRIWIVGPDYKSIKEWDYLWRELVTRRTQNGFHHFYVVETRANSPQQGNMKLVLNFGPMADGEDYRVTIEGKSATNPESLQGVQVYLAIGSEAAELDERVETRYLATRCKYKIYPTTPKVTAAWLKALIEAGEEDPELSIESFEFDGHCNPNYDWDLFEIEKKKAASRSMTGRAEDDPWFAEQFLGKWTGAEERVLPYFDVPFGGHPGHVAQTAPSWAPYARVAVSCDYGYHDPAVALLWLIGPDDSLFLMNEVYERNLAPDTFAEKVFQMTEGYDVDYYVGDPKKPEVAEIMRRRGVEIWDRDKKAMADRAAGHLALVDMLQLDMATGAPKLRVHARCENTRREWRLLRKRLEAKNEFATGAMKGRDDAYDAARYFVQTRPAGFSRTRLQKQSEFQKAIAEMRRYRRRQAAEPVMVSGAYA